MPSAKPPTPPPPAAEPPLSDGALPRGGADVEVVLPPGIRLDPDGITAPGLHGDGPGIHRRLKPLALPDRQRRVGALLERGDGEQQ